MTIMRQRLASRANKHQFRAKLSVEELEPRCLLSSAALLALAGSDDFLAAPGLDRDNDDGGFLNLFPGTGHDLFRVGQSRAGNANDSTSLAILGQQNGSDGPPSS